MYPKKDITTQEDIHHLINQFYQKVLIDPEISYLFDGIKNDLDAHLPRLYSFWENVLFYTGGYQGNPMDKHAKLHQKMPLKKEHFNRWLALWKTTVEEEFTGEKAQEAINKATQIAFVMENNILSPKR